MTDWGTSKSKPKSTKWRMKYGDLSGVSDSLKKRARQRSVRKNNDNDFTVIGSSKLSDEYDTYHVTYDGSKWQCECWTHAGGEFRAASGCSHLVGVLLELERTRLDDSSAPSEIEAGKTTTETKAGSGAESAIEIQRNNDKGSEEVKASGEHNQRDIQTQRPNEYVGEGQLTLVTEPEHATQHYLPTNDSIPRSDWEKELARLPEWVEGIRPHQLDAVGTVLESINRGQKLIFIDAPTGSGKTLIGEMIRLMTGKKTTYICSSLSLQDQFVKDFDYARVIRGRSNYPTIYGSPDTNCSHCTGTKCIWCPERDDTTGIEYCPYKIAKNDAAMSPLAVLNTRYFLYETNKAYHSKFSYRDLVVADEADILESELMGFAECWIGARYLRSIGEEVPKDGSRYKKIGDWLTNTVLDKLITHIKTLPKSTVKDIEEFKRWETVLDMVQSVAPELSNEENVWVRQPHDSALILKPVYVNNYGQHNLWRHGGIWIAMSATIISAEHMAMDLGWDKEFENVQVPMTFPIENRPIKYIGSANMTYKNKEQAWPVMREAVAEKCRAHPNDRILVHAVSYELMNYLAERVKKDGRTVVTYSNAKEREGAIAKYRATPGSILIAPSLDRGVDFKDDDCRVVIIAKIPFPNLKDRLISSRANGRNGNDWYSIQTIRSLVQMSGRGVRSKSDHCVTYIMDQQFMKNIWNKRRFIPNWWMESLVWENNG